MTSKIDKVTAKPKTKRGDTKMIVDIKMGKPYEILSKKKSMFTVQSGKQESKVWCANTSTTPIVSCHKQHCKACSKKCYSLKAYRVFKTSRTRWDSNWQALKNNPKLAMDKLIEEFSKWNPTKYSKDYFRINKDGDFGTKEIVEEYKRFARSCPDTKFLAFTKFSEFNYKNLPTNMVVRFSVWLDAPLPKEIQGLPKAWISGDKRIPTNTFVCPGSCRHCRHCWDNPDRDVQFKLH